MLPDKFENYMKPYLYVYMGFDDGGLKRKILNTLIFVVSPILYPFKKIRDYRDEDVWGEEVEE